MALLTRFNIHQRQKLKAEAGRADLKMTTLELLTQNAYKIFVGTSMLVWL